MPVYVDAPIHTFGRMKMCHMLADTEAELHEMADKIGVNRKWYQANASTPHYDICKAKRELALKHGATEADKKKVVEIIQKLRNFCFTCGEEKEPVACWSCGGEGGYHDCFEDTCCCLDKESITHNCDICKGKGCNLVCPACHPEADFEA